MAKKTQSWFTTEPPESGTYTVRYAYAKTNRIGVGTCHYSTRESKYVTKGWNQIIGSSNRCINSSYCRFTHKYHHPRIVAWTYQRQYELLGTGSDVD